MLRPGIRGKITWIVLFSIISLTICMTVISYVHMERLIIKKSTAYLHKDLIHISNEVENMMQSIDDLTKSIISDSSVQQLLGGGADPYSQENQSVRSDMDAMLSRLIYSRTEIDSVYMYTMDGNILFGDQSVRVNKSLPFRAMKAKVDQTRTGLTVFDPPSHNTFIPLSKAIKSTTTFETIGYIQVNLKEYAIRNMYRAKLTEERSTVLVHNAEGYLVSSMNEGEEREQVAPANRGIGRVSNNNVRFNGERSVLETYQSGFNRWTYTVVVPVKYITGDINTIVYTNLVTGLVFIGIAIVCSIIIGWKISQPIIEIAHSIRKVEFGDFNIQTKFASKDEIGVLSRAFNKMVQEINRLINEVYKLKILEKEQQIRMLQAQINPHFLYNTFDSINFLAQKYNAEPVSKMIVALGALMRASILNTSEVIPLRDELGLIEKYLAIQKIRFGGRLEVHYDINEDVLDMKIPKLIIQPIVENSIIHGLENRTEPGIIEIAVTDEGKYVVIRVDDNGCGAAEDVEAALLANKEQDDHSGGVGLTSVYKRLQLIFGEEALLSFHSKVGAGTQVALQLPKKL